MIGHDTMIGRNTKIMQNVTIGGRSGVRVNPVIGEEVLIGANTCIIGDVKVGNGAKVGAHTVVLKDVPENSVVVGNSGRIIKYIGDRK